MTGTSWRRAQRGRHDGERAVGVVVGEVGVDHRPGEVAGAHRVDHRGGDVDDVARRPHPGDGGLPGRRRFVGRTDRAAHRMIDRFEAQRFEDRRVDDHARPDDHVVDRECVVADPQPTDAAARLVTRDDHLGHRTGHDVDATGVQALGSPPPSVRRRRGRTASRRRRVAGTASPGARPSARSRSRRSLVSRTSQPWQ